MAFTIIYFVCFYNIGRLRPQSACDLHQSSSNIERACYRHRFNFIVRIDTDLIIVYDVVNAGAEVVLCYHIGFIIFVFFVVAYNQVCVSLSLCGRGFLYITFNVGLTVYA